MNSIENLKTISPREFALMGVHDIAYVKSIEVEGAPAYAVHSADGTQVAVFKDRDVAFATVLQNDLEPVSVH